MASDKQHSISPAGAVSLPKPEEHATEYERLARLAEAARGRGARWW